MPQVYRLNNAALPAIRWVTPPLNLHPMFLRSQQYSPTLVNKRWRRRSTLSFTAHGCSACALVLGCYRRSLAGQRFPIFAPTEIGRDVPGIPVAFDTSMSRRHASLAPGPGGLAWPTSAARTAFLSTAARSICHCAAGNPLKDWRHDISRRIAHTIGHIHGPHSRRIDPKQDHAHGSARF